MWKGAIMACFAVFLKSNNKQIRVFSYNLFDNDDMKRANNLAIGFAMKLQNSRYPCTIEQFTFSSDIGYHVFDTERANNRE